MKHYILLLILLCNSALASVDSNLHKFFDSLGYDSNFTSSGAYSSQAAGYYTGGSLFLRNKVKDYQLISVSLPSFSGGCSGIDAYLGSFSVINSSQITAMMKNIMSAGGAYAFDLALTTTVPQIKTVKDYLQKYVNDINSANINSCNTAEDLVGGMWPKTQASQQQICRDVGSQGGAPFSDWAAARQGCGTGGQFTKGMDKSGPRRQEVIVNKNLIWDALHQQDSDTHQSFLTNNDDELAELLMSLSGTIVYQADSAKTKKKVYISMADSDHILNALLNGGDASVYVCTDKVKCLNPKFGSIHISTNQSLIKRVSDMTSELNALIANDDGNTKMPDQMKNFLQMTPIPILKYISNSLALGKVSNPEQFSEIIAIDMLNKYLSNNIMTIQQALMQSDTPMTPQMIAQMTHVQQAIATKIENSYHKLSNIDVFENSMRADEQQLTSRLIDQAAVGQETN